MDQCTYCTCRGDLKICLQTNCRLHESWFVEKLQEFILDLFDSNCDYLYKYCKDESRIGFINESELPDQPNELGNLIKFIDNNLKKSNNRK